MNDQKRNNRAKNEGVRFTADVMLGSLANLLILAGFDCSYHRSIEDSDLLVHAEDENRILLTRDQKLIQRTEDRVPSLLVRSDDTEEQVKSVLETFGLSVHKENMFSRCPSCNRDLESVDLRSINDQVPDETRQWIDEYYQCPDCEQVYWKGSHYEDVVKKFKKWNLLGNQ